MRIDPDAENLVRHISERKLLEQISQQENSPRAIPYETIGWTLIGFGLSTLTILINRFPDTSISLIVFIALLSGILLVTWARTH